MNKKYLNNKASALLLVIFISSILSLLSFVCWYKSSLLLDLVSCKEQFYKNFYLSEAFLKYSILLTKNNFDNFQKKIIELNKPVIIDFEFKQEAKEFLFFKQIYFTLFLEFYKKSETIFLIKTFLKEKGTNRILFKLSCRLSKERSEKRRNEFITDCFTIGNSV